MSQNIFIDFEALLSDEGSLDFDFLNDQPVPSQQNSPFSEGFAGQGWDYYFPSTLPQPAPFEQAQYPVQPHLRQVQNELSQQGEFPEFFRPEDQAVLQTIDPALLGGDPFAGLATHHMLPVRSAPAPVAASASPYNGALFLAPQPQQWQRAHLAELAQPPFAPQVQAQEEPLAIAGDGSGTAEPRKFPRGRPKKGEVRPPKPVKGTRGVGRPKGSKDKKRRKVRSDKGVQKGSRR